MQKIIFFIFLFEISFAQEKYFVSGIPKIDFVIENHNLKTKEKKSSLLSGTMSAIVPGTGQFYNGDYLKSAIFFSIEVGGFIAKIIYDKKAEEQTEFFENYADNNWSVMKYAEWCKENYLNWEVNDVSAANLVVDEIIISDDQNLKPWERVDWRKLNEFERAIGGAFSHTLPKRPEQQYYELIGKYHQFRAGWNDYDETYGGYYTIYSKNVSPNLLYYSKERGKANNFYDVSKFAMSVIVLNHILSSIDAVWIAKSSNLNFSSQIRLETSQTYFSTFAYPVAKLKIEF